MAYEELASVSGIVDLSPQEALDRAEAFMTRLGYETVRRTDTVLTVQRRPPDQTAGQSIPNLTIEAVPQPAGGVRISVRGNDREGIQQQQAAWVEWSESLPRKQEARTDEPRDQQRTIGTPNAPLPPPPRRESTVWRGTKLAFGGCVVLPALLLIGFVACIAVLGSGGGGGTGSKSGDSKGEQITVGIGEPVTVGDVSWTVTNATQTDRLKQKGAPSKYAKTEQGNFVVVDFDFTNNGSEPVTLDNESLTLIDSAGRQSKANSGYFLYIPEERRIFLERINPGVTKQGRAIFTVAPDASSYKLQAGDTNPFTNRNGYIDLGF